jgi:mono/diheme cytochrome c family protein
MITKRRIANLMGALLVVILFSSCSKTLTVNADSLYVPTTADVTANATLADLQAGRTLYLNSCGRCHSLFTPGSFSTSVIPGMASRAGLSSAQTIQLTKYVTRGL